MSGSHLGNDNVLAVEFPVNQILECKVNGIAVNDTVIDTLSALSLVTIEDDLG